MNDVIAHKRSSLKPGLVEAAMFLKLNMSMILNYPTDVMEPPIWNTLIPPHLELPYDIDNSNDNEDEEDDEVEDDDDDDDLSQVPVKSEEVDYTC